MNKILFIVNPISGSGNGSKFYKRYLENHPNKDEIDIVVTEKRGHATEICSTLDNNYSSLIVCGGDGTFNEVVNGLAPNHNLSVGLLPVGSGNDFISNFKQSDQYSYLINRVIKKDYSLSNVDVGHIRYKDSINSDWKEHYFINSLGIGFDAYVAYLNQNTKKIKGKMSYIYSILIGLFNSVNIDIGAKFDEKLLELKTMLVAIGNGKTAGGRLYLTPKAEINDSELNYTILKKTSKLKLVFSLLPKAIRNKIEETEEIKMGQFKSASIELKIPYFIHADGESLSDCVMRVEISVHPNKLNFITF